MKLADYLNETGQTPASFTTQLNASGMLPKPVRSSNLSRCMLSPDTSAFRLPRRPLMRAMYVVTRGAVTPNDFYDLPPLGAAAHASEPRITRAPIAARKSRHGRGR